MPTLSPSALYCAYLRKSRRDVELEALGQGDTLSRHAQALADLARRLGIRIARTYREVVSGDTIAERPEIRQLLADVNAGMWDGVLVMDVDRLGRGDSIDQGVIMQSFLYSNTLIITPDKIYDPSDDSDAEFFEIKLFFSRREYNMIKKRMQRGRLASAMDGCYQGGRTVYGYERYKLQGRKGWSLRVVPEKAEIVRAVFDWYAHGMDGRDVGAAVIADRLNAMGLRTDMGNPFEASYIRMMLKNPVYIGKIQWNRRTTQYTIRDGKRVGARLPSDNPILVDGLHDAIIDRDLWNEVQAIFATHAKRPKNKMADVANPLSGLVVCVECGKAMQLKGDSHRLTAFLECRTQHCPTCATPIDVVEGVVLDGLRLWVSDYEAREAASQPADVGTANASAAALEQLEAQRATLQGQLDRLFDLLEQGVYDVGTFRQRRSDIEARMRALDASLASLEAPPAPDPIEALIPQIRTVLAAYDASASPAERLALFRSVLDHVSYTKTQRCYRNNKPTDHLFLVLYPRVMHAPDHDIVSPD